MSQDIRKCSKSDLDELNRQIAIYKSISNLGTMVHIPDPVVDTIKSTVKRDSQAEQLDLWGGGV